MLMADVPEPNPNLLSQLDHEHTDQHEPQHADARWHDYHTHDSSAQPVVVWLGAERERSK
jgi:hypothetical protein